MRHLLLFARSLEAELKINFLSVYFLCYFTKMQLNKLPTKIYYFVFKRTEYFMRCPPNRHCTFWRVGLPHLASVLVRF